MSWSLWLELMVIKVLLVVLETYIAVVEMLLNNPAIVVAVDQALFAVMILWAWRKRRARKAATGYAE